MFNDQNIGKIKRSFDFSGMFGILNFGHCDLFDI